MLEYLLDRRHPYNWKHNRMRRRNFEKSRRQKRSSPDLKYRIRYSNTRHIQERNSERRTLDTPDKDRTCPTIKTLTHEKNHRDDPKTVDHHRKDHVSSKRRTIPTRAITGHVTPPASPRTHLSDSPLVDSITPKSPASPTVVTVGHTASPATHGARVNSPHKRKYVAVK